MKPLGELIKERGNLVVESNNLRSERAAVLKEFIERLNSDREKSGLRALPPRVYAIRLSHLDLWDLKIFLGSCREAKHFSRYFWWSLKPR